MDFWGHERRNSLKYQTNLHLDAFIIKTGSRILLIGFYNRQKGGGGGGEDRPLKGNLRNLVKRSIFRCWVRN